MGSETETLGHLTAHLSHLSSEPEGCNHYVADDLIPFFILLILSLPLLFLMHSRSLPSTPIPILTHRRRPRPDRRPLTPSAAAESPRVPSEPTPSPLPAPVLSSFLLSLAFLAIRHHCRAHTSRPSPSPIQPCHIPSATSVVAKTYLAVPSCRC